MLLTLQPVIPSCARNLERDALSVDRDERQLAKLQTTPLSSTLSVDLTESENRLLSKGLGFCPRPKRYDIGNLLHDTKVFSRRKSHFNNRDGTNRSSEKCPSFVPKNDWQPPKQSPDLETFISSVESDTASHKPSKPKHDNLTKSERSALYDVQNRQEIIKPADKGSAVVVMNRDHYISEAERQLGDSTYYRLLDHDPIPEFAKEVSKAIS